MGVGAMLARQDRAQVFTRSAGVEAGFLRFRRIASILMNNDGVAFVVLCVLTHHTPPGALRSALIAPGILLILVGVGIKVWAAWRLGAAAYYWHNFFSPGDPVAPDPPGPYRFMNNPMYTVGYLQTYGLALVLGSVPGLVASGFAQGAILVFHYLVEEPHYQRLIGTTRAGR